MVAVIHASKSLRNALNYNEAKVKAGLADLLEAGLYPKEAVKLTFSQKLSRLENLAELNQLTRVNSVHISLNFDPSEQLSEDRLREIAALYLEKIGFAFQPYLLYRHRDAGHPHVHLVTTNIRADGSRISLHNLGRNESEQARKEIELLYGLFKAEDSALRDLNRLKPVDARKVDYGRLESKRAMANVISVVLQRYRYASLSELNAVLGLYNVFADRGSEDSRVFQNRGLVYRILDKNGNKLGVPVKASDFYFNPGLKFLEVKYEENKLAKGGHQARIRQAIEVLFLQKDLRLNGLVEGLRRQGIDVVLRQNEEGLIYGLTFVDHRSGCVFNGSALGKSYSAKSILARCSGTAGDDEKMKLLVGESRTIEGVGSSEKAGARWHSLTDALLVPEEAAERMDWELKRKRKKKKKRRVYVGHG